MFELFCQTLNVRKWTLIVYCLANVLFLWMFVGMYPSIQAEAESFSEVFERYPEGFLDALGVENVDISTLERFLSMEQFSFTWPLMAILLLTGFGGSMIAGEIERGTIDLLLAKPIARHRLFLEKYAAGLVFMVVFSAVSVFGAIPFARAYGLEYVGEHYWVLFAMTLLFGWAVLSVTFMFSAFASERNRVSLYAGGLFLVMYVARVLSGFVDRFEWLKYASFFHYADFSSALVENTIESLSIVIFIAVALMCTVIGVFRFSRRDINVSS